MPRPPRRRWRRRLLVLLVALLVLVLLLPYAIALAPVRAAVERQLTERLGADVRIDALSFSWLHGIDVDDLVVANPAGFPSERPAVQAKHVRADVGLGTLLRGLAAAEANASGVAVFVEQRADGTSNLQQLANSARAAAGEPAPPGEPDEPAEPATPFGFDVTLADAHVEIRREGRLLETLTGLDLHAVRAPRAATTRITLATATSAGAVEMALRHDGRDGSLDAELKSRGLDLSRWQPLLDALSPERITALAGRVEGGLAAVYRNGKTLQLDGELTVDAPRLAGPIVRGLDLRADRWTIAPRLAIGFAPEQGTAGVGTVDAQQFLVDLGWLSVRGKQPPADGPARAAFAIELDVAALARAGELLPASLRDGDAKLTGEVVVPTRELPQDLQALARVIAVDARFAAERLSYGGFELRNAVVSAAVQDGAATIATGDTTRLDGGPLTATVTVDLQQQAELPTTATLRWNDGQLALGTADVLRYAMPLLAGDLAATGLSGTCDLELSLGGPARRAEHIGWLAFVEQWSGSGVLQVTDAGFAPAPALQGLLTPFGALPLGQAPIGDAGRLSIESFEAPFEFQQGSVRTLAARWLAKGKRIGLDGTVALDGTIDYRLDLSALLQGHRDGERVLQALNGALPPARLLGTLSDPRLALPEVETVVQRLLQGTLENQGKDLLRRELERLLRRK